MLCLKTNTPTTPVRSSALADQRWQEVATVELETWLGCETGHGNPRTHAREHRRGALVVRRCRSEHEVMIIALTKADLLVIAVDPIFQWCRSSKVEWSSFDGLQLAGRDHRFIHGRDHAGSDLEEMIFNCRLVGVMSRQIKVAVMSQIDDGRLIGHGSVSDLQRVVVHEREGDADDHIARVSHVEMRAGEIKPNRSGVPSRGFNVAGIDSLPEAILEASRSSMKMVGPIIDRERIELT